MRFLSILILVSILSWTGYWYYCSRELRADIDTFIENQSGVTNWNYKGVSITGYPYRLDTKINQLEISDTDSTWSIALNELAFLSLIYKDNHHIMAINAPIKIQTRHNGLGIDEGIIRTSLKASNERLVSEIVAESKLLRFSINRVRNLSLKESVAALRFESSDSGHLYKSHFKFKELFKQAESPLRKNKKQNTISLINRFIFEGDLTLQGPIVSLNSTLDLKSITNINSQFQIGNTTVQINGNLSVSGENLINGKLIISVNEWKSLLNYIAEHNIIKLDKIKILRSGFILRELAKKPSDRFITAPLLINKNKVFLGPVLLGSLPSQL